MHGIHNVARVLFSNFMFLTTVPYVGYSSAFHRGALVLSHASKYGICGGHSGTDRYIFE